MSYLLAFLGFAALIILHEAGHFVAAKAVGMRVERFSLFFGPMLFKRRIGETEYGVGVIPLGGYVKISGMSPDEPMPPEVVPRAYLNQPVWKRIVVIVAGPAVNLVIAFVIVWLLLLTHGTYSPSTVVAGLQRHSPAAAALKLGDRIVSIDGVHGGEASLRREIATHTCPGGAKVAGCPASVPAVVVVRRHGRLVTLRIVPRYSIAAKRPLIGFDFGYTAVGVGPWKAATLTTSNLWRVSSATVSAIVRIVQPQERKQLHGVVGVYSYTEQSFQRSPAMALQVLALISLSLAVINLFPFLPLDGGHVTWALAEKLRGRRISVMAMYRYSSVGIVLLLFLVINGVSNDISRLTG